MHSQLRRREEIDKWGYELLNFVSHTYTLTPKIMRIFMNWFKNFRRTVTNSGKIMAARETSWLSGCHFTAEVMVRNPHQINPSHVFYINMVNAINNILLTNSLKFWEIPTTMDSGRILFNGWVAEIPVHWQMRLDLWDFWRSVTSKNDKNAKIATI